MTTLVCSCHCRDYWGQSYIWSMIVMGWLWLVQRKSWTTTPAISSRHNYRRDERPDFYRTTTMYSNLFINYLNLWHLHSHWGNDRDGFVSSWVRSSTVSWVSSLTKYVALKNKQINRMSWFEIATTSLFKLMFSFISRPYHLCPLQTKASCHHLNLLEMERSWGKCKCVSNTTCSCRFVFSVPSSPQEETMHMHDKVSLNRTEGPVS